MMLLGNPSAANPKQQNSLNSQGQTKQTKGKEQKDSSTN
jgi:hypothetical protein